MGLANEQEIKELNERVKSTMLEYMEEAETAYTKEDVEECMNLMATFLEEMEAAKSKDEGMSAVEKVVLALNDLNEKCEYELIETDQREDLAEIIILAGYLKGFNDRDDDVTEDWREW